MTTDDAAYSRARTLAKISFFASLLLGVVALTVAVGAWPEIPERVPTHFGASGDPDAWGRKSFATIFVLPLMALLMGPACAALAWTSVAEAHVPPRDREGLRRALPAVAMFLAGVAIFSTALLSGLAIGATQVAAGHSRSLGWWPLVAGAGLGVWCLVGALVLVVKHSPLGAPKEVAADPKAWKWGAFYVNPADPCLWVEKRWGGGYTINFGIPAGRRLAFAMLAFFMLFAGLGIWAAVAAS